MYVYVSSLKQFRRCCFLQYSEFSNCVVTFTQSV